VFENILRKIEELNKKLQQIVKQIKK